MLTSAQRMQGRTKENFSNPCSYETETIQILRRAYKSGCTYPRPRNGRKCSLLQADGQMDAYRCGWQLRPGTCTTTPAFAVHPSYQLRAMSMLPTRFLPVGAGFTRQGVTLKVVARPKADTLQLCECCRDCYFEAVGPCNSRLQCSCFDRRDHRSVWFVQQD